MTERADQATQVRNLFAPSVSDDQDAMAVTLKKNGIDLPQRFIAVAKNFKPRYSKEEKKK